MYAAFNSRDELVYPLEAIRQSKAEKYSCPVCSQSLVLKTSSRGWPFFSHRSACGSGQRTEGGGEGDRHVAIKEWLYQECQQVGLQVEMEGELPDTLNRPDLLIYYKGQPARIIEVQLSPISAAHLRERQKVYQKFLDAVVWLIDDASLSSGLDQAWFQRNLHHRDSWGYYVKALDWPRKSLKIYHGLPLFYSASLGSSYRCSTYGIQVQRMDLLAHPARTHRKIQLKKGRYKVQDRIQQLRRSPYEAPLVRELYQVGLSLGELPDWVLAHPWRSPVLETPAWTVMAWVYGTLRDIDSITLPDFKSLLLELIAEGRIVFQVLPFLEQVHFQDQFLAEVFQALVLVGFLRQTSDQGWAIIS